MKIILLILAMFAVYGVAEYAMFQSLPIPSAETIMRVMR